MKPTQKARQLGAPESDKARSILSASSPSVGRLLIATLVWIGILAASLPLTGCPKFSALYAAYVGALLALVAGELAFLNAIFRKGKTKPFLAWKKFTGYSLPLYYFAHALPRIQWSNADLIGPGREIFLFALTLLATASGLCVFFLAGRPSTLAAVGVITDQEASDRALRKKKARERRPRGFLAGLLDWVDAVAWAAIAVLVVNIFIFQLYEVPSESMVPAFLIKDRPFTLKLGSGPRIPLTQWRLPFIRLPHRGDVVTIANPRYPENHRVDLKKYVSQFVYMVSLTTVHLDATLPDGTPKADPLVKRIVGLPGEKLMMVDDILYARRSGQAEFRRVNEPWAAVDLWKAAPDLRSRVQHVPIDEATRALLTKWDRIKNAAQADTLANEAAAALAAIDSGIHGLAALGPDALPPQDLTRVDPGLRSRRDEAVRAAERGDNPYSVQGAAADDLSLALAAAASPKARAALQAYAQGARTAAESPAADEYERGSRNLNLLVKTNLLARLGRVLTLLSRGAGIEAAVSDAERQRYLGEARELYLYLQGFYDSRNFPEFPRGEAFLGGKEYFAMGDNRYNSLDFRFRDTPLPRALDPGDPASVVYISILEPFPVELQFIEGHAVFRLWPLSRLGPIR